MVWRHYIALTRNVSLALKEAEISAWEAERAGRLPFRHLGAFNKHDFKATRRSPVRHGELIRVRFHAVPFVSRFSTMRWPGPLIALLVEALVSAPFAAGHPDTRQAEGDPRLQKRVGSGAKCGPAGGNAVCDPGLCCSEGVSDTVSMSSTNPS